MTAARKRARSIRAVALPAQHGAWGFLFEPLLLGLLVAASWAGLWLSLAAIGAFLLSPPLTLAIKDRRKGKRYDRTKLAERFALGYALLAGGAFALAVLTAANYRWLLPVAAALPLAGVHLYYTLRSDARALLPEVGGALAFGAVAPAIALLAGWQMPQALALWALVAARVVGSILYVRARLKLEHGKPTSRLPVHLTDGLALLALALLVSGGLLPATVLVGMVVLLGRALLGLSRWRKPTPAKWIGLREIFYGLFFVGLAALGYRL